MTDRARFRGQDPDNAFGQEDYSGQDDTSSALGYDDSMGYDEAVRYDETQDQGGRMPGADDGYTTERRRYHGQDEYGTHQNEFGNESTEGDW
ncbi:hypothetical protein [Actinomadura latina]|uniref:Uncharacterized protein n=1 Tax=Actinomadura latina TaxID=163603 RepID=A0A846YVM0_9ACTN|nr:hypothetical protein [Actinomadura latina]NKZ04960.1 hypothetical protein [Actinomadura latina]